MSSFLCDNCDYPAQSETEFMDPRTENIIDHCPNCGSKKTKTQKIFNFRLTWDMLHGMGIVSQLSELGDVSLKLKEYDAIDPPQELVSVEVPEDVRKEFDETISKAQEILKKAEVHDFLKKINVRIIINVVVFRSS